MRKIMLVFIGICLLLGLSSCKEDSYLNKGYASIDLDAKGIPLNYDGEDYYECPSSLWNKVEVISTYDTMLKYKFKLDYTEEFFEEKELLFFSATCCSSDNMKYKEILLKDDKLYPIYTRRKIGKNEPVTEDFIVLSYYVELEKSDSYQAGEILFEYHK